VRWAAALVALAACQEGHAPGPAAVTQPRNPDAIGAATRCRRAMDSAPNLNPADVQRVVTGACADVYVERRCRDAWADTTAAATVKLQHILADCTQAYCAILPAPKPARCSDSTADPRPLWAAIHLLDLGAQGAAILDAPTTKPPTPLPKPTPQTDDVTWRIPIITITADAVALDWRPPHGADERALSLPIAQWDCAKLKEQLALEVTRTWPTTVRPTRSKQLVLAADAKAPYATVLKVADCAQDRGGPRQLYPDVTLTVDNKAP
jgi:hypothetical protein